MAVGAAVKGATSLVELILKKFGDDTAGAAKELERLGGFPESVSQRIASGELPMDAASVEARRIAQGYGDELYHGSTHDIKEFNGAASSPTNDWGQGTYLSDSIHDSSKNYAGEGPDLTSRLYRRAEEMWLDAHDFSNTPDGKVIGGKKFTEDEWRDLDYEGKQEYLRDDARKELKGPNNGVMYPVRVQQDGLLNTYDEVELPDYRQRALDELDYDQVAKNGNLTDEMEDEIYEMMDHLEDMDSMWVASENPNHNLFSVGNEMGADMSGVNRIEEGDTWESVREGMGGASFETDEGAYVGAGGVLAEVMRKGGAKGVVDDVAPQRFPSMEAGQHTVMFPGSENQIRSVNAAFDPQYKGSNIMGGAAGTAGLTGLLAAGQSEDSEAGPLTAAAKALLDRNFTESAVSSATDMANAYKSREALTTIGIDEFLNLAQKGYAPDKFDALQNVDKFDEVPFLSIGYRDGSDGVAHVTGHEGRHRAMTLKSRGETQMPVRVRGDIRWDQQDAPNFDYVEDWPSLLASQNDGITSPFPFKRGDSNLLDSSDMALRSKYTPPKKAEPKPDSYDTEILAELLDEFNFEKGNADPRLLAGTAAGTAGLLAAPALMKDEPVDPTAPLPAPAFGEQMGKAGEVLMTILDAPMTGWQGIARGLSGVMNGEDVVTAGAEANHMMKGGSEEGFSRLGDKVEGLLSPIDKRFPYLNVGKSAGDTVGLLASLIAPF